MSPEENKAVVRRFYEVTNHADLPDLAAVVALDVILHDPFPVPAQGLTGMTQLLTMFLTAFPDHKVTIHEMTAEGTG
jgi:predicted ester cyclase